MTIYSFLQKVIMLLPLLLAVHPCTAQRPAMLMPPFLKPGDRIAVISPSSRPDAKTIDAGCKILRQWGYEPVVAPHVLDSYHGFAGTIANRTTDLLWALRDTTCRAIMCTRGGDGAVQLLSHIHPTEFRLNPKWLIGFSDITALHSTSVVAGVMSIHGPMLGTLSSNGGTDSVCVTLQRMLEGRLPTYHVDHHELDQEGHAEGILVGGNFSVLCALAGSQYDCLRLKNDLILFIEDTDEPISKVDRMLHHLEVRGVLPRLKGIVLGHFTSYRRPDRGFANMKEMLHEYLQHYDIPVCYGFPTGHARPNFPLIEGCHVKLDVTEEGTDLTFIPQKLTHKP